MLTRIRTSAHGQDRGFTLIELLVVMIIIGVLASIAIPVFLKQKTSAYRTAALSDARNLATNLVTTMDADSFASMTRGNDDKTVTLVTTSGETRTLTYTHSPHTQLWKAWMTPSGDAYCIEFQYAGNHWTNVRTGLPSTITDCGAKPSGYIGWDSEPSSRVS